jgi:hypothetical protein
MVTRREFLKASALAIGAVILDQRRALSRPLSKRYFGLNQFILNNPEAVFILLTSVDVKTNTAAIRQVGYDLAKTLFVAKTSAGNNAFPVSGPVAIKPNITSWYEGYIPPVEETMGIQTDPYFVEGLIESLFDLTVPAPAIYVRDANYFASQPDGAWYSDLAQRTGINLHEMSPVSQLARTDIQWTAVKNGVWYSKIPYLWPVNSPGSCLINVAKFKSHLMGMTLCSKNLQGTNALPYVRHCTAWGTPIQGVKAGDVVPNAFSTIQENYLQHKDTIPRWSTLDGDPNAGSAGGLWMETHTARCLDNNSVLNPLINIIEGVYGREGPFVSGPSPEGYGINYMTNVVIFGKNARHVDIIGTYLAGHEPGNFGLFHIAKERGLSTYLNPHDIPLYEWKLDGSATATPLDLFPRAALRTPYLVQAGEESYHMVDQPYDYSTASIAIQPMLYPKPDIFVLKQDFPNPSNPTVSIQYYVPTPGFVRIEVADVHGRIVDIPVDASMSAGDHLVTWRSEHLPSGTYIYRILCNGMTKTKSMILLK